MRAYGQKDPLNEYKREAFNLFSDLLTGLREQVVGVLANAAAPHGAAADAGDADAACTRSTRIPRWPRRMSDDPAFDPADPDGRRRRHAASAAPTAQAAKSIPTIPSTWGKVSRNASCPCGSGKKFKHCHGRV